MTKKGPADVRLTDEGSIPAVIAQMTLLEKATLCGGAMPFETHAIERLGIPKLVLADGHNGINSFHLLDNYVHHVARNLGMEPAEAREVLQRVRRKGEGGLQALLSGRIEDPVWDDMREEHGEFLKGLSEHVRREFPAAEFPSCFPTGIVMGATWDPDLVGQCGRAVAEEARAFGMDVLLGPNVNIHRDPLCGRVFESYSEDPYLSARIGVGYIGGVQDAGVAAVVKHYVANNQEHERLGVNEKITDRALREIYFPSFEAAVREADVWMVMSAYNKVNGEACAMHRWLLTDVLRAEWGFDGFVVSDWGAAYDRIAALRAGNDLEMPGPCDPQQIVQAVEDGKLSEGDLDERVGNILRVMLKLPAFLQKPRPELDREQSRRIARQVAAEGMVLLRNERDALPLRQGRVAVFGQNAQEPISTGAGSAGVISPHVVSLLEGLAGRYGQDNVVFGELDDDAELAVIAIGVRSGEGADRPTMELPAEDVQLIRDVARQCRQKGKKSVVVLNVCAPVEMAAWVEDVDAVLLAWMAGMEIGHAVADVLSGAVCPSGKLPLTIPRRYKDAPTFLNFPGEFGEVVYGEGIFVGYRYYDTAEVAPLYAFGHGLSYTRFEMSDLTLSAEELDVDSGGRLTASVNVSNTGDCAGKEVVQLYVQDLESPVRKPVRELKGFAKVPLAAGETTTVRFEITPEALRHYDAREQRWCVQPSVFRVMVGSSSRDIRASAEFRAVGADPR